MRKFFFWCEFSGPASWALLDVVQVSEAAARMALAERVKWELPGCTLVKAELAFSRCESLTEFLRKVAPCEGRLL